MDGLPEMALVESAYILVECIKTGECGNGTVFDFLPKLLALLASSETVTVMRSNGPETYSGPEFKTHILNKIATHRWPQRQVVRLATVLREAELTVPQTRAILLKIFS